ncbi:MAG: fatty acid desaturase [Acidimicrobiales bacterium]
MRDPASPVAFNCHLGGYDVAPTLLLPTEDRVASARRVLPPTRQGALARLITLLVIFGPLAGVVAAAVALFGRGVTTLDLALVVAFYAISGHGISVGYHRMLTHRSFKGARWVTLSLAVAGSLAFEGSVNGWVANHRRHHAYTDRDGDPHSPYAYGTSPWARTRGALHAHVGWLFQGQPTDESRWAPDLIADPALVTISRLFPLFCVVSLAAPTLVGWAFTQTLAGAVGGLVWGGAGPSVPHAPQHLRRQLGLPPMGQATLHHARSGPGHQLRPPGGVGHGRQLAQPSSLLPPFGPPRGGPRST